MQHQPPLQLFLCRTLLFMGTSMDFLMDTAAAAEGSTRLFQPAAFPVGWGGMRRDEEGWGGMRSWLFAALLSSPGAIRGCRAAAEALPTCVDLPLHPKQNRAGICPTGSPCQGWAAPPGAQKGAGEAVVGNRGLCCLCGETTVHCGRTWEVLDPCKCTGT